MKSVAFEKHNANTEKFKSSDIDSKDGRGHLTILMNSKRKVAMGQSGHQIDNQLSPSRQKIRTDSLLTLI